jgi:ABC-type sugar transport system substrate-binding protein
MTKAMQPLGTRLRAVGIALALAMVLVPAVAAQAQTFKVLYNFGNSGFLVGRK